MSIPLFNKPNHDLHKPKKIKDPDEASSEVEEEIDEAQGDSDDDFGPPPGYRY